MHDNHEQILMSGKYSVVARTLWNSRYVATKRPTSYESALKYFENEIHVLRSLAHPNIVSFLALLDEKSERQLVLELMPDGDLEQMIKNKSQFISPTIQYSIGLDIAEALHYLHELLIIHRDLKPANILLRIQESGIIAKLCDFGFATSLKKAPFEDFVGTPYYFSPELLITQYDSLHPYSTSSDTYAIGLILWSLVSKKALPYANIKSFQELSRHVHLENRESIPNGTHPNFARLITQCWATQSDARPNMSEVIHQLRDLKKQTSPSENVALSEPIPKQSDKLQIKGMEFWKKSKDAVSQATSALEKLAVDDSSETIQPTSTKTYA